MITADHVVDGLECRKRASEYRAEALRTVDPVRKSEFEELERKWLCLATRFDAPERRREPVVVSSVPSQKAG